MRLLGIDPGGRRMGLAVADGATGIATPLAVVPYGGVEAAGLAIATAAGEVGATVVVLGLPTRDDGSETAAARRSQLLAAQLVGHGLRVELQPELLTTNEARRRARSAGRDPREAVDDIAAQIILEDFLGRRRRSEGG